MSKSDKRLSRLLKKPKDFTFKELETILSNLGFVATNEGVSSGSAVKFVNYDTGQIIRLHKPHPSPILKPYLVNMVIEQLKQGGYLND